MSDHDDVQRTHFVGDDCEPDGHRSELLSDAYDQADELPTHDRRTPSEKSEPKERVWPPNTETKDLT